MSRVAGWKPTRERSTVNFFMSHALQWLAVLMAALSWATSVPADDWPQLRGPRGDGVSAESGLADHWPERGPPVLWSRDLGQGYSSFAVVGGRAYTQYQSVFGQYVICLDSF